MRVEGDSSTNGRSYRRITLAVVAALLVTTALAGGVGSVTAAGYGDTDTNDNDTEWPDDNQSANDSNNGDDGDDGVWDGHFWGDDSDDDGASDSGDGGFWSDGFWGGDSGDDGAHDDSRGDDTRGDDADQDDDSDDGWGDGFWDGGFWDDDPGHDDSDTQPEAVITAPNVTTTGEQVNLSARESTDDEPIESYEWTLGDNTTIAGENVSHTYTTPGNYTVTLTVTDDDGETNDATTTIEVRNSSDDSDDADEGSGDDSSDDTPTDVPDDDDSTDVPGGDDDNDSDDSTDVPDDDTPTDTPGDDDSTDVPGDDDSTDTPGDDDDTPTDTPGNDTDTPGDDDGGDDDSSDDDNETNSPPDAEITAPDTVDAGEAVALSAAGSTDDGGITEYQWTLGDGATAAGENVSHSYSASGSYTVTLTVTDDDGATDDATATIEVENATDDGFDEREVERLIHERINEIRSDRGLDTLTHDADLRPIARGHSEDMAVNDYFSHTSPDGDSFVDRYDQAGYDCPTGGGENIAMTGVFGEPSESEIANQFVDMWMNSTGHRENILRERWNGEGLGVYYDSEDGEVYATQNFC